jgi:putative ABC transport system permease protein
MNPRSTRLLANLDQDVRYAIRALRRNPGLAAVTILTLALGIGANTAVFSIADAALFRPLPYRDPGRLVEVFRVLPATPGSMRFGVPREAIDAWRQQADTFEGVEAYIRGRMRMADADAPVAIARLSPGMLRLLGVSPVLGRSFDSRDATPSADRLALISHRLWKTAFGATPSAFGAAVTLDNLTYTIVGVMPPTFAFPGRDVQVWLPLTTEESFASPVARVRKGLTVADAQRQADRTADLLQQNRPTREGWKIALQSLEARRTSSAMRAGLLLLLGGIASVLLIACANVATLLLAHTTARERELAVRLALGASRGRLLRQVLTESVVLATAGGIAAVLVGVWAIDALGRALPVSQMLGVFDAELNLRVLAFASALSLATGLLCGALPAFRSGGVNLLDKLTATSHAVGLTRGHRHLHRVLIGMEVALTFVLLTGAILLANSFLRMVSVDIGFDPRNLAAIRVRLPERYQSQAARDAFFETLLARARLLPRVRAVTSGEVVPPQDGVFYAIEKEDAAPTPAGGELKAQVTRIQPDYFTTLGIPVLQGRVFDATDRAGSPPVVAVDRETARFLWPNASALGRRLKVGRSWRTVVAVVGHVKGFRFTDDSGRFQAYTPFAQDQTLPTRTLAVRNEDDAGASLAAIRALLRGIDPDVTILSASTVDDSYGALLTQPRFLLNLMSVFAIGALGLVCAGVYGVLSYSASRRKHEIGVRMALGASSSAVVRNVVAEAFLPTSIGLALGLVNAIWLGGFLRSQLYGVSPHDPPTTALAAILLLVTAALAAYIPARRAARLEPAAALRHE